MISMTWKCDRCGVEATTEVDQVRFSEEYEEIAMGAIKYPEGWMLVTLWGTYHPEQTGGRKFLYGLYCPVCVQKNIEEWRDEMRQVQQTGEGS